MNESFFFQNIDLPKRKTLTDCIFGSNVTLTSFLETNWCNTKTNFKQLHPKYFVLLMVCTMANIY